MINTNKKSLFAVLVISIIMLCIAMPFVSYADSVDLTDRATADSYLSSYSDNVGGENFDEELAAALTTKRNDVKSYATWLALLPPIIAITLALITKEVYSSLFIGILSGGLLFSNFSLSGTLRHIFADGFLSSITDTSNICILVFVAFLGIIVALMNKSGGSAAFGRWASKHIQSRVGAQLATIALGILIFIDDCFNCLTVGSVMRPITDKFNISRSKLAYIIDSTAAPICIIAPISSWAAAVTGFVSEEQIGGFELFIKAIPYNFYALLTIVMLVVSALLKLDYGPMKKHETNALNGDLFSEKGKKRIEKVQENNNEKSSVWDLVAPVLVLIISCIIGLIYTGGFFTVGENYHNFINAFSNADGSMGLVSGAFVSLIFTIIYFIFRRVLSFKASVEAVVDAFKIILPAMLILICAWTLKAMTDSLGAKIFIAEFVRNYATSVIPLIPAVVFLIGIGLSFSTGTSWGTFGILIPIVLAIFGGSISQEICIISISACMAGAVCGDHCSPISDTTIMSSAGAQCNHINHVRTQLPYALTVAAVSFVSYIIAGYVQTIYIALPVAIVLIVVTLIVINFITKRG